MCLLLKMLLCSVKVYLFASDYAFWVLCLNGLLLQTIFAVIEIKYHVVKDFVTLSVRKGLTTNKQTNELTDCLAKMTCTVWYELTMKKDFDYKRCWGRDKTAFSVSKRMWEIAFWLFKLIDVATLSTTVWKQKL